MKLKTIFLIGALGLSATAHAHCDTRNFLLSILSPVVDEKTEDGRRVVEYCPDNLCILINASMEVPIESQYEFAVIYFYYQADFPEFKDKTVELPNGIRPRVELEKRAQTLLKRYQKKYCPNSVQNVDCVIEQMKEVLDIHVYFRRTDEGNVVEEEL